MSPSRTSTGRRGEHTKSTGRRGEHTKSTGRRGDHTKSTKETHKENWFLFVCSEAVETKLVNLAASDTSPNGECSLVYLNFDLIVKT